MPWCEECAKYLTPNSMNDDGTCPVCGDVIEDQQAHAGAGADAAGAAGAGTSSIDDEKAPWHFKLLVVAVAAYLGWRVVDLFM